MKLQTKEYAPVGEAIWLDFDLDELTNGSKLIMPNNAKMPPFIEATVLAAGPKCLQVKAGDRVLLNSVTITRMKVGSDPEVLFTKEDKIVAIVKDALG